MAHNEKRTNTYRVVFQVAGCEFKHSPKTLDEPVANAGLARVEDTLRRLKLGTLTIPEGADIATFVLSDGTKTAIKSKATFER